nr:MAG TPA: hypothetical protein [Caudoviricetes sp.]
MFDSDAVVIPILSPNCCIVIPTDLRTYLILLFMCATSSLLHVHYIINIKKIKKNFSQARKRC